MCTSLAMNINGLYFGRNMDIDYSFGERIAIVPRNYIFNFTNGEILSNHYAIIGMACVERGYPLFADAVNEKGLCIAGLNFPNNAYYFSEAESGKTAVSPFELIPWLLSSCANVDDAKEKLNEITLVNKPFSNDIPLATLHWHIADKKRSIVLESTKKGINIYNNPVGVLSNNPTFDFHIANLSQYLNLTTGLPNGDLTSVAGINDFGNGTGSIGLPGDFSSASRFVRCAYLNINSVCGDSEEEHVLQHFHILDNVAVVNGSIRSNEKEYKTIYSCCMNAQRGIYYYKTYYNTQISTVDMTKENLSGSELISYPLATDAQFLCVN